MNLYREKQQLLHFWNYPRGDIGGLLFGYDTAVISGTVESLRKFFIEPFGLPLDQANALEGFVVSSA